MPRRVTGSPRGQGPAEFLYRIPANRAVGFHAGGRFLDLSQGLAPDKFTAEVRKVTPVPSTHAAASIAWSRSPEGPYQTIWEFDPKLEWKDGEEIDRTLVWPEIDRRIEVGGVKDIYVRYRAQDLAVDGFRLAVERRAEGTSPLAITHVWSENGAGKSSAIVIPAGAREHRYSIDIPAGVKVENRAILFETR